MTLNIISCYITSLSPIKIHSCANVDDSLRTYTYCVLARLCTYVPTWVSDVVGDFGVGELAHHLRLKVVEPGGVPSSATVQGGGTGEVSDRVLVPAVKTKVQCTCPHQYPT